MPRYWPLLALTTEDATMTVVHRVNRVASYDPTIPRTAAYDPTIARVGQTGTEN